MKNIYQGSSFEHACSILMSDRGTSSIVRHDVRVLNNEWLLAVLLVDKWLLIVSIRLVVCLGGARGVEVVVHGHRITTVGGGSIQVNIGLGSVTIVVWSNWLSCIGLGTASYLHMLLSWDG